MTLNTSGPISLGGSVTGQSIAVELGQSPTGIISLNDANVRQLAQVPAGTIIVPTNFYGKSNFVFNFTGSLQAGPLTPNSFGKTGYGMGPIATTADGNRFVIGAYGDGTTTSTAIGSVYTYIRSGTSWAQTSSALNSPYPTLNGVFGKDVAMSNDGSRLVVGCPGQVNTVGSYTTGVAVVYVWNSSTQSWDFEQTLWGTPVISTFQNSLRNGACVAINADGTTIAIGAEYWRQSNAYDLGTGFIFTRSGSTWTQQAMLPVSGGWRWGGSTIALSADGNTCAIGAQNAFTNTSPYYQIGAFNVFTRTGSTWTKDTAPYPTGITVLEPRVGSVVALSPDGNTLAVCATGQQSTFVYTKSGTTWTQQATLTGPGEGGCSFANNGTWLAVGAMSANSQLGIVYVYSGSGASWTQQFALTGPGPYIVSPPRQGYGVSFAKQNGTLVFASSPNLGPNYSKSTIYVYT